MAASDILFDCKSDLDHKVFIQMEASIIEGISKTLNTIAQRTSVVSSNQAAMAAGDSDERIHGLWVRPALGYTSLIIDPDDSKPSLKNFLYGISVGYELGLEEHTTLGIGGIFDMNKSWVEADGDKVKGIYATSIIPTRSRDISISGYGSTIFDKILLSGNISYGWNKVDPDPDVIKEFNPSYDKTQGGEIFSGSSLGLEASLGYVINLKNEISLIPSIGFEYIYSSMEFNEDNEHPLLQSLESKTKYAQRMLDLYNSVGKIYYSKFLGKIGAKLAGHIARGDKEISPAAHVFIRYPFLSKFTTPGGDEKNSYAESDALKDLMAKIDSPEINLGVAVDIRKGNLKYGAGADAIFRKDYQSYQGFLECKISL